MSSLWVTDRGCTKTTWVVVMSSAASCVAVRTAFPHEHRQAVTVTPARIQHADAFFRTRATRRSLGCGAKPRGSPVRDGNGAARLPRAHVFCPLPSCPRGWIGLLTLIPLIPLSAAAVVSGNSEMPSATFAGPSARSDPTEPSRTETRPGAYRSTQHSPCRSCRRDVRLRRTPPGE